jgi:hypothetical protein
LPASTAGYYGEGEVQIISLWLILRYQLLMPSAKQGTNMVAQVLTYRKSLILKRKKVLQQKYLRLISNRMGSVTCQSGLKTEVAAHTQNALENHALLD